MLVDPLAAWPVRDENDNAEANRVITQLRVIQSQVTPKPTFTVLKHEKQRDEESHRRTIRGAKVWLGAFDQVIHLLHAQGLCRDAKHQAPPLTGGMSTSSSPAAKVVSGSTKSICKDKRVLAI